MCIRDRVRLWRRLWSGESGREASAVRAQRGRLRITRRPRCAPRIDSLLSGSDCVRWKRAAGRLPRASVGPASCVVSAPAWSHMFDSGGQDSRACDQSLGRNVCHSVDVALPQFCVGLQLRAHGNARWGTRRRCLTRRAAACLHGRSAQASCRTRADAAHQHRSAARRVRRDVSGARGLRRERAAGEGGSRPGRTVSACRSMQRSDRNSMTGVQPGWRSSAGLRRSGDRTERQRSASGTAGAPVQGAADEQCRPSVAIDPPGAR